MTFAPVQAWSFTISGGGLSASSAYGGWTGHPYLAVYTNQAQVISPGDSFQLYNSGTLKEATVFTVAFVGLPGFGFSNVIFSPVPLTAPQAGDVATVLPRPVSARWLGSIGHVTSIVRSSRCPGGPDTLSLLLQLPADYRTDALNPGRIVEVWRGGSCVWEGKLDEPTPGATGWTVTAHGAGTFGTDFAATYGTWNADDPVNGAIGRGMRWLNPGIGAPYGIYLSQVQDSGSQTITEFLNLLITGGGLLWQVTPGNASSLPAGPWILNVTPFRQDANGNPTKAPDRILISKTPVARTIVADINVLVLRYQATADTVATSTKKAVAAIFRTLTVSNQSSVVKHGPMEYYVDVTSAGVLSVSKVQVIGQAILSRYVRASWAGPFTVGPGEVRNAGGQPVDLGCDQAGLVYQVMVTDAGYGGEVAPAPLIFMSGEYEYDEDSGTAVITPFQSARHDIASLISSLYPQKF